MNKIQNESNFGNKQSGKRYWFAIISILVLTLIDQSAKYFVDQNMELYEKRPLINQIIELEYIHNPGAAWGILANKQIWFYICTVLILIVGCIFYIHLVRIDQYQIVQIILLFIGAGAIGNFIDRLRFQYVIDFLHFQFIDFPVFNIADCYITIGCFTLFFLMLFYYKEDDITKMISIRK